MRVNVATAACVAAYLAAGPTAQGPLAPRRGTSGGSRVISPAVVATALFEYRPSGDSELQLLVLWRGTTGWFLRGRHSGSWTQGSGQQSADQGLGVLVHEVHFGDVKLHVRLDRGSGTAEIGEARVTISEGRAVLVDNVDGAGGPQVVGTRQISLGAVGVPPRVEPLLRDSPELVEFLRCDEVLPDATIQSMVAAICRNMTGLDE